MKLFDREYTSIKAIVVGGLVMFFGPGIWGAFLGIYLTVTRSSHLPQPGDMDAVRQLLSYQLHPFIAAVSQLFGLVFTIVGGYIAARMAKKNEVYHATLSSFICVVATLVAMLSGMSGLPMFFAFLVVILNPLVSSLGGYIREAELKRKDRAVLMS